MNNKPWEETKVWDNESQYLNWIRGELRRLWSNYPLRTEFLDEQCREVTQEERGVKLFHRQTKKVGQCVYCSSWFPKSKLEVDHKTPSDGCNTLEKAEKFLWYCGGVLKDDMQLACKPCHKINTYAERQGLTFEEAKLEKEVVQFKKLKAKDQIELLSKLGYSGKNAAERIDLYRQYLKGG